MSSLPQPRSQLHLAIGLLIACSGFLTSNASAQVVKSKVEIKEVIWGFNGRVLPGQFNVVSVLLDNGTADPVDGRFQLQKTNGLLDARGVVYDQTGYIGPAGRRWIQFYPYISDDFQTDWRLTYFDIQTGKVTRLGSIKQSRQGASASKKNKSPSELVQVVVLLPDDSFKSVRVPQNLTRFPDGIFPPYATGTAALHTVFLDHEPDWEEPRQQAFMSWLRLGGNVHILKSRNNQFPSFSSELANLGQPLSEYNVGLGRVQRHEIRLADLTDTTVENAVRNGLTFDQRLRDRKGDENTDSATNTMSVIGRSPSDVDLNMYQQLQERTQPEHAWWLIYLLAIAYILLIFPGCYIISKNRKRHFLTTYATIAGLSVVFSVLFLFIGQRGYGESTWMQTLAVARVADEGDLAVQQWSSLFVTSGDQYLLEAKDSQALMNAGVGGDNTFGQATPGKEARTAVRIPPYSAQTINAARHLGGEPWELNLLSREIQGEQLVRLSIKTTDSFPATDDRSRFYAITGNHIYTLKFDKPEQRINLFGSRTPLSDFCQIRDDYRFMAWGMQNTVDDGVDRDELFLDEIAPLMVKRALLADRVSTAEDFFVPMDRIRLLVMTTLPGDLDLKVTSATQPDLNPRHSGWILYSHDLTSNP